MGCGVGKDGEGLVYYLCMYVLTSETPDPTGRGGLGGGEEW